MATKSFQYFIRIQEFVELIKDIAIKYDLLLIFYKGGKDEKLIRQENSDLINYEMVQSFDRLYLTNVKPNNNIDPLNIKWLYG